MISSTDPFPAIEQLPVIRLAGHGSLSPEVEAAAAQARAAGYEDGLHRGYRDGQAAAHDDVRSDVSFALTALHAAIEDLHRRDANGGEALSAEVVELALGVARAVIGREIATAADPGRDALVRALALAPERGDALVRLNPDDLATLGSIEDLAGGRRIELISDATVARGDCVLNVGPARVDAQVGAALDRVRAVLTGAAHEVTADAGHEPLDGSGR